MIAQHVWKYMDHLLCLSCSFVILIAGADDPAVSLIYLAWVSCSLCFRIESIRSGSCRCRYVHGSIRFYFWVYEGPRGSVFEIPIMSLSYHSNTNNRYPSWQISERGFCSQITYLREPWWQVWLVVSVSWTRTRTRSVRLWERSVLCHVHLVVVAMCGCSNLEWEGDGGKEEDWLSRTRSFNHKEEEEKKEEEFVSADEVSVRRKEEGTLVLDVHWLNTWNTQKDVDLRAITFNVWVRSVRARSEISAI